jgi:hypothetical protein
MAAVRFRELLVLVLAGCAPAAASPQDAPPKPPTANAPTRPWLDVTGDSIVGFGLLRVVPPPGGGSFRVHYTEKQTEYSSDDQYQLFVLPGDGFATKDAAHAGEFLAFTRTEPSKADGYGDLTVTFRVTKETTVIVAYGPWTAPDAGRPPGDHPTFSLEVTPVDAGGAFEWIESEMGELITTNWTNRPDVKRGAPVHDPVADADLFVEVRPMILYDGRMVRGADERVSLPVPEYEGVGFRAGIDHEETTGDAYRAALRADRRIPMTPALTERFRRVPIRWR